LQNVPQVKLRKIHFSNIRIPQSTPSLMANPARSTAAADHTQSGIFCGIAIL